MIDDMTINEMKAFVNDIFPKVSCKYLFEGKSHLQLFHMQSFQYITKTVHMEFVRTVSTLRGSLLVFYKTPFLFRRAFNPPKNGSGTKFACSLS